MGNCSQAISLAPRTEAREVTMEGMREGEKKRKGRRRRKRETKQTPTRRDGETTKEPAQVYVSGNQLQGEETL